MPVLKIAIQEETGRALKALADHEMRDPRAQAALIIRSELERRGLLATEAQPVKLAQPVRCADEQKP